MENDIEIWEIAKVFGKWLRSMGHGLSIRETAFAMLEMALEFDKRFKYVGNDVYMRETAKVFEKRLKYEGNDVDFWEVAQICGELA